MIRKLLLFSCLLAFSQCTPCWLTSCGCDNDNSGSGLQVIEQMEARFGTFYQSDDSVTYYNWNSAALTFRITRYSPLANAPIKGSWSLIPTANACDPVVGNQQATTYIANVMVKADQSAILQQVQWSTGDNISNYFNFGEEFNVKSIGEFLANHNVIYVGNQYQLKLNTPIGTQKKLKITVQLTMSDGQIFNFPNLEMRLRN